MLGMMLLAAAGGLALAEPLASAPITWTLSVEGDTFRAKTVGLRKPAAERRLLVPTPRDICTPIANKDCWGNDIKRQQANSAADCCTLCKSTPGCGAWTFDTTRGHAPTCNVKSWAPEFGGRKWVLRVRDWPSQDGVFGFG